MTGFSIKLGPVAFAFCVGWVPFLKRAVARGERPTSKRRR